MIPIRMAAPTQREFRLLDKTTPELMSINSPSKPSC
jgi:hypothetical protein